MTVRVEPSVLSRRPRNLAIEPSKAKLQEIWALRDRLYRPLYPDVNNLSGDKYDKEACIFYSNNQHDEVTSTGRVVFDGSLGLPVDELVKSEVDKLRDKGLTLAEWGKLAISREAKGIYRDHLQASYEVAVAAGVDSLVFIIRDKNVGFYQKIAKARVILADIGYSYGTQYTFSFLEMKLKESKRSLSKWLKVQLS